MALSSPHHENLTEEQRSLLETRRLIPPVYPAQETGQLCPTCNRVLLRINNGTVMACYGGHLFSLTLEPIMGV